MFEDVFYFLVWVRSEVCKAKDQKFQGRCGLDPSGICRGSCGV